MRAFTLSSLRLPLQLLLAASGFLLLTGANNNGCGGGDTGGTGGGVTEPPPCQPIPCGPGTHVATICGGVVPPAEVNPGGPDMPAVVNPGGPDVGGVLVPGNPALGAGGGACHDECVPDNPCPDGMVQQVVCPPPPGPALDGVCEGDGCSPPPSCEVTCVPAACPPGFHQDWTCWGEGTGGGSATSSTGTGWGGSGPSSSASGWGGSGPGSSGTGWGGGGSSGTGWGGNGGAGGGVYFGGTGGAAGPAIPVDEGPGNCTFSCVPDLPECPPGFYPAGGPCADGTNLPCCPEELNGG